MRQLYIYPKALLKEHLKCILATGIRGSTLLLRSLMGTLTHC